MSNRQDDDVPASFASPPCFMHELNPNYLGLTGTSDFRQQVDVERWRIEQRDTLIAARQAVTVERRIEVAQRIADGLNQVIGDPARLTIGVYWPFRGEPDLRSWIGRVTERGGHCALPVVVAKNHPMSFRRWVPGEPLEPGNCDIPIPKMGKEVRPDIVIAPVVGFDPFCFRLGYGGGFFDRTLAALSPKPHILGVGYTCAKIPTIYPQPHDIAMNLVVTEVGITRPPTEQGR